MCFAVAAINVVIKHFFFSFLIHHGIRSRTGKEVNQSSWNSWGYHNHCLLKHISLANVVSTGANSEERIVFSIHNVKITVVPVSGL